MIAGDTMTVHFFQSFMCMESNHNVKTLVLNDDGAFGNFIRGVANCYDALQCNTEGFMRFMSSMRRITGSKGKQLKKFRSLI